MALLLDPQYPEQLSRVLKSFKKGHPVALPTESVYGLAAPISKIAAISKIFELKGRPRFNPLVVHVLTWAKAKDYATDFPEWAQNLAEAFWPGPLSLLVKKSDRVPDLVTAGSSRVVLRCPSHPVFRTVLSQLGEALVAPSANRYMGISPVCATDVLKELSCYGLEAVVDGGASEVGIESTIVGKGQEGGFVIYRLGAISKEEIEAVLGSTCEVAGDLHSKVETTPGSQAKHYAPKTPLHYVSTKDDLSKLPAKSELKNWVLLKFDKNSKTVVSDADFKKVVYLSKNGSEQEAAATLFSTLRKLDESRAKGIVACPAPAKGLGLAINDRLKRAGSAPSAKVPSE